LSVASGAPETRVVQAKTLVRREGTKVLREKGRSPTLSPQSGRQRRRQK
jgi:hypothetical protein